MKKKTAKKPKGVWLVRNDDGDVSAFKTKPVREERENSYTGDKYFVWVTPKGLDPEFAMCASGLRKVTGLSVPKTPIFVRLAVQA